MDGDQALIQMLLAMRAQMEAMHATMDAALSYLARPPDPESGCPHPPEKRVDTTAQGGPKQYLCLVCDQEVSVDQKEGE